MSGKPVKSSAVEGPYDDVSLADELRWVESGLRFARSAREMRAYVEASMAAHGLGLPEPTEAMIAAFVEALERQELDAAPL